MSVPRESSTKTKATKIDFKREFRKSGPAWLAEASTGRAHRKMKLVRSRRGYVIGAHHSRSVINLMYLMGASLFPLLFRIVLKEVEGELVLFRSEGDCC